MIEQDRPSKTQVKQRMHEMQALGERLAVLSPEVLDGMDLPDHLRAALDEVRRVPALASARGARRRHLQYIGRLMRDVDPGPIREKLAALEGRSGKEAARLHDLERWRERLIEDDAALEAYLRERAGADVQHLRALIRNARAERASGRPPKAYRELFRLLRDAAAEGETTP